MRNVTTWSCDMVVDGCRCTIVCGGRRCNVKRSKESDISAKHVRKQARTIAWNTKLTGERV